MVNEKFYEYSWSSHLQFIITLVPLINNKPAQQTTPTLFEAIILFC
jgi:hypothetical protein